VAQPPTITCTLTLTVALNLAVNYDLYLLTLPVFGQDEPPMTNIWPRSFRLKFIMKHTRAADRSHDPDH